MNHCNQVNAPILSKFRGDDNLSASTMTQKYNGHGNSNSNLSNSHYQANVPAYMPSAHLQSNNDEKQRLSNSYQPSNTSNSQLHQSQPEINPDICSALLNQQNDAKRGWSGSSNVTNSILNFFFAIRKFRLAIFDAKLSCCRLLITFTGKHVAPVFASLS